MILTIISVSSCKTIEYIEVPVIIEVNFDPPPERTVLEERAPNETLHKFFLNRVNYYSALVKEWESWGILVYESVDQPLPESLLLLKNLEEN